MNTAAKILTKRLLAKSFAHSGLSRLLLYGQRRLFPGGYIRALCYHGTPLASASNLRAQLEFFQTHFSPVTRCDLERFLRERTWTRPKPGLLLSFDDGLRCNFDVAAPLLEEYGFTGWFFVPPGFVEAPHKEQRRYAEAHRIRPSADYSDGRVAMSWDEVRALARRHVIGCHSYHHVRLGPSLTDRRLRTEIIESKAVLERELGEPVDCFGWVGGEESSYSAAAARHIERGGYRFAFMTDGLAVRPGQNPLQLQRIQVESTWSMDHVRWQLNGVMDLYYARKRDRIRRRLAARAVVDSPGAERGPGRAGSD